MQTSTTSREPRRHVAQPTDGPHALEPRLSVSGEALRSEAVPRRRLSRKQRQVWKESPKPSRVLQSQFASSSASASAPVASWPSTCFLDPFSKKLPRLLLHEHRRSCRHSASLLGTPQVPNPSKTCIPPSLGLRVHPSRRAAHLCRRRWAWLLNVADRINLARVVLSSLCSAVSLAFFGWSCAKGRTPGRQARTRPLLPVLARLTSTLWAEPNAVSDGHLQHLAAVLP